MGFEVSVSVSCSIMSDSLQSMDYGPPGKNTGVGCHALLQGSFLTHGSNLGLLHCRQILYHLSHQGSPSKCQKVFNLPISSQLPGVMGTSIVIHDYYCPILLTGRLTHRGVK